MQHCDHHDECLSAALKKANAVCASHGARFTSQRQRVFELIWQSHKPAKAYDILEQLQAEDGSAKPPTVYRAIDFLLEQGLIHKLSSLNAFVGCSHPSKHRECYFLICSKCEEISECCNTKLADVIDGHAHKKHFTPQHVMLEIEGLCRDCATEVGS